MYKITKLLIFFLVLTFALVCSTCRTPDNNESKSITVTSPLGFPDNEGEWYDGQKYNICWSSTGNISNVKIELYGCESGNTGSYISTIVASTPNISYYAWDIPTGTYDLTTYKIRISDCDDSSVYDDNEGILFIY